MKEIFIHVGLHKTGTTFLQQKVFPFLKGVNFLYNGRLSYLAGPHKKILFSNEALSGIPYQPNEKSYYEQFCFNITQLKSTFRSFKLIIGFREPSSLLSSFYKQHLHEGGTTVFDQFFGNQPHSIVKEKDLFFSKFYFYLLENFDKEDLFCYEHGQLLNEPEKVLEKLLLFLGQERSRGLIEQEPAKLNVSVQDNFEGFLLSLNRLDNCMKSELGISLNSNFVRRNMMTPRIIAQSILPKILGRKEQRDLSAIRLTFASDWDILLTKIRF